MCKLKCPIYGYCGTLVVHCNKDGDEYIMVSGFIGIICDGIEVYDIPMDISLLADLIFRTEIYLFFTEYVDIMQLMLEMFCQIDILLL